MIDKLMMYFSPQFFPEERCEFFIRLIVTTPLAVLLFAFFTQNANQFNKPETTLSRSISIVLPPR
ncbi:hypothetical protein LRP31_33715 (plasmid) [Mesorhizobium mediterraneum]|uniref:hypothetical protein n=1 Tax=Mesorhizobium mediterraneum TaxID=43617 RepID=UPI000BA994E8|nr:hypothetical protein [Mesorhizobium mediterraneum]RWN26244.1 MAG: hypothetical protein EOR96_34330 [Mesorhizobium sp.]WIW57075.1 hypothetical protein LRP31_33715 [Mesorhizobium mediterraneum]